MRSFIIAVLDDDEGINETAYRELCKLEDSLKEQGFDISDILDKVDCTDGRYYLKTLGPLGESS